MLVYSIRNQWRPRELIKNRKEELRKGLGIWLINSSCVLFMPWFPFAPVCGPHTHNSAVRHGGHEHTHARYTDCGDVRSSMQWFADYFHHMVLVVQLWILWSFTSSIYFIFKTRSKLSAYEHFLSSTLPVSPITGSNSRESHSQFVSRWQWILFTNPGGKLSRSHARGCFHSPGHWSS